MKGPDMHKPTPKISMAFALAVAMAPVDASASPAPLDPMWKVAACGNPRLTRTAISKRVTGHVSALFDITVEGKVTNIRITDSHPAGMMDYSAKQALKRWEYFAYLKDGKLSSRENVSVTFTFGPDQTRSCTHAPLPELPSTAGLASDPFAALRVCPHLKMSKRAARKRKPGLVSLQYDINKKGEVKNVQVLEELPDDRFTKEARNALIRWKYSDFLTKGAPTPRPAMRVTFHFGEVPEGANKHHCAHAPWDTKEKVIKVTPRERPVLRGG